MGAIYMLYLCQRDLTGTSIFSWLRMLCFPFFPASKEHELIYTPFSSPPKGITWILWGNMWLYHHRLFWLFTRIQQHIQDILSLWYLATFLGYAIQYTKNIYIYYIHYESLYNIGSVVVPQHVGDLAFRYHPCRVHYIWWEIYCMWMVRCTCWLPARHGSHAVAQDTTPFFEFLLLLIFRERVVYTILSKETLCL